MIALFVADLPPGKGSLTQSLLARPLTGLFGQPTVVAALTYWYTCKGLPVPTHETRRVALVDRLMHLHAQGWAIAAMAQEVALCTRSVPLMLREPPGRLLPSSRLPAEDAPSQNVPVSTSSSPHPSPRAGIDRLLDLRPVEESLLGGPEGHGDHGSPPDTAGQREDAGELAELLQGLRRVDRFVGHFGAAGLREAGQWVRAEVVSDLLHQFHERIEVPRRRPGFALPPTSIR
jgi:hypothetical protein